MQTRTTPTTPPRLLVTAGPTHEPIDSVRYIANRSSGRLGIAVAKAGAERGWTVTLLLGPTHLGQAQLGCDDSRVEVVRFRTTADLESLLRERFAQADILVQAAAVADFRPKLQGDAASKLRRTGEGLTLELQATPDLLAMCAQDRRPGQVLVGFALEPAQRLIDSARDKLARKGVDMIVANPLETMDSPEIAATLVMRDGPPVVLERMSKEAFGRELVERIGQLCGSRRG